MPISITDIVIPIIMEKDLMHYCMGSFQLFHVEQSEKQDGHLDKMFHVEQSISVKIMKYNLLIRMI